MVATAGLSLRFDPYMYEKNITINFMKSNYTNINVSKNKLLSNTHCYTLLFQTTSYKKSYYGQHNLSSPWQTRPPLLSWADNTTSPLPNR
jgi:hypothetical protein